MNIRKSLARWLYPQAFSHEAAYARMKAEAVDAYHWLNSYPDAADTIRWLLDNNHNRNRPIGEPAIGHLPSDISSFRDHLERRNAAIRTQTAIEPPSETNVHLLDAHDRMTVNQALSYALRESLSEVIVLAFNEDGEFVLRSNEMSLKDALWLVERAKLHIFDIPS